MLSYLNNLLLLLYVTKLYIFKAAQWKEGDDFLGHQKASLRRERKAPDPPAFPVEMVDGGCIDLESGAADAILFSLEFRQTPLLHLPRLQCTRTLPLMHFCSRRLLAHTCILRHTLKLSSALCDSLPFNFLK